MNAATVEAIDAALVRRYEEHRLLTVKQVADLYQASTRTVRRLIDAGKLPHTRIAGAVRIPQSEAIAYLRANTYGATAK